MKSRNPFDDKSAGIAGPLWIIAAIFSFLFIFGCLETIQSRAGWGPDDQLRMVQIRDFLNGQSWFDWTQYRMNAPDGAPMHWSRLIELPIAFLILIFTPIFGQDIAEMIAGTAIPLIGLALTSYMIGRVALSLWNRQAAIFAIIMTWINPAIAFQFRPMRIDHHGWQIMLASLALWSMFWPSKKRGGIALGAALAFWLHISLEGLPITAAFFILLGWRWIIEKAHGQRLIWTITSFTIVSFALYIVTQGLPVGAASYCDSISPPYLAATATAAAIRPAAPAPIMTMSGSWIFWIVSFTAQRLGEPDLCRNLR
jgi:asparagine N-glycosylation enzyme membrane subunit Stt3